MAPLDETSTEWKFADGPPAPTDYLLSKLARELGDNVPIEGLEQGLTKVFTALSMDDIQDLQDAVGDELEQVLVANGLFATFRNTLRKYAFGPAKCQGNFRDTVSALPPIPNDEESESSSAKGERKFSVGASIICNYLTNEAAYGRFDFSPQAKALLTDALALSSNETGVSKALTIVFKFHLVVFKIVYLDMKIKERYSYLLATMRGSITMQMWMKAIKDGWTNRRKGRIVGGFHFNVREVENNKGFDELRTNLGPKMVYATENGSCLMPAEIQDFSTSCLVNYLIGPKPRPDSAASSSSQSSGTSSMRDSPVPIQPSPNGPMTPDNVALPSPVPVGAPVGAPVVGKKPKLTPLVPKFSGGNLSPNYFGPQGVAKPIRPVVKKEEMEIDPAEKAIEKHATSEAERKGVRLSAIE